MGFRSAALLHCVIVITGSVTHVEGAWWPGPQRSRVTIMRGMWPGRAPSPPVRGLHVGCIWRVHGLGELHVTHVHGLRVEGVCGGCQLGGPPPIRGLRVEGCLWRVHGLGEPLCHPCLGCVWRVRVEGACGGCVCGGVPGLGKPPQPLSVGCMWRAALWRCMAWASPTPPLSMGCVWRVRVEGAWPGRAPCRPCPFRGLERRLTTPDQGAGGGQEVLDQPAGLRHSI